MSLFQCKICGCKENTALACQGCDGYAESLFDWTGLEYRKGKKLCSACAPPKLKDGTPSSYGKWHGVFDRIFLPMNMFRTNRDGNLEHIESGSTDTSAYAYGPRPPTPIGWSDTDWIAELERTPQTTRDAQS